MKRSFNPLSLSLSLSLVKARQARTRLGRAGNSFHPFKLFFVLFLVLSFCFQANIAKPLADTLHSLAPVTSNAASNETGPYCEWDASSTTLTFKYGEFTASDTVKALDMSQQFTYGGGGIQGRPWNNWASTVTTVAFDSTFKNKNAKPLYLDYWFFECSNLATINGIQYLDTSSTQSMQDMFYYCTALTTLDLSYFDTSQVTAMSAMFTYCTALTTLDLSTFDTSKVTTMGNMFYGCSSLTTLNLSNFNTSQVTNMENMFSSCTTLTTLNLSTFDTSKSTKMDYMFYNCSSLTTLDLSGWDTSAVTTADGAFGSTTALKNITLSKTWFNKSDMPVPSGSSWYSFSNGTQVGTQGAISQSRFTVANDEYQTLLFTTEQSPTFYTVSYISDGGSPLPATQNVLRGSYLAVPQITWSGYTLAGWYKEAAYTNQWNFSIDTVTQDTTLYAKWTLDTYTLTFQGNNGTWDSQTTQTVTVTGADAKIKLPSTDPTYADHTFNGYWTLQTGGTQVTADTANPYANTTYYAQWLKDTYFTVIFDTDGGSAAPDSQQVKQGDKVTKPADPTKQGFVFVGWYNGENPWNFDTDTVTQNITLIAHWKENPGPTPGPTPTPTPAPLPIPLPTPSENPDASGLTPEQTEEIISGIDDIINGNVTEDQVDPYIRYVYDTYVKPYLDGKLAFSALPQFLQDYFKSHNILPKTGDMLGVSTNTAVAEGAFVVAVLITAAGIAARKRKKQPNRS